MQIDFARFPEIPQGSYSQSTADPDVLYVFFDEKQTDGTVKRLDVGEILQGAAASRTWPGLTVPLRIRSALTCTTSFLSPWRR